MIKDPSDHQEVMKAAWNEARALGISDLKSARDLYKEKTALHAENAEVWRNRHSGDTSSESSLKLAEAHDRKSRLFRLRHQALGSLIAYRLDYINLSGKCPKWEELPPGVQEEVGHPANKTDDHNFEHFDAWMQALIEIVQEVQEGGLDFDNSAQFYHAIEKRSGETLAHDGKTLRKQVNSRYPAGWPGTSGPGWSLDGFPELTKWYLKQEGDPERSE